MTSALLLAAIVGQVPSLGSHVGDLRGEQAGGFASSGLVASGAYTGTCVEGNVVYDSNGAAACAMTTDTAPTDVMIRPAPAYSQGTQSASDIILCPGQDETKITIDTAANCGTDTVTVVVFNSSAASTTTVLTEATEWTKTDGNNAATATSLASAVDALAGVSATAAAGVVYVTLDLDTCYVTLAESDATCTTVSTGTTGSVKLLAGGLQTAPVLTWVGDPDTGFYYVASNRFALTTGGTVAWDVSDTSHVFRRPLDMRDNEVTSATQVLELGTAASTSHSLASGGVLVGGALEVNGALHLDGVQADVGATCTLGTFNIDTGGATVELCYCNASNTWLCVALAAGPTD